MLALWFRCENKSMLRSSSCLKYCLGPRGERVGWVLSEQIYLRVANPFAPTKKTTNGRLFLFLFAPVRVSDLKAEHLDSTGADA